MKLTLVTEDVSKPRISSVFKALLVLLVIDIHQVVAGVKLDGVIGPGGLGAERHLLVRTPTGVLYGDVAGLACTGLHLEVKYVVGILLQGDHLVDGLVAAGVPIQHVVSTVIGIDYDALAGAAENIGKLLNRKHCYFVPFGQDDPGSKPTSMVADFAQIPHAIEEAYRLVGGVHFENAYCRRDIGKKALAAMEV